MIKCRDFHSLAFPFAQYRTVLHGQKLGTNWAPDFRHRVLGFENLPRLCKDNIAISDSAGSRGMSAPRVGSHEP
jgi:hypothetical protein